MRYAFYPGCVSRGGCPELYPAAVKVAQRMGFELVELTDVGCTGSGVLSQEVTDPINARTFAKAEQMGLPIMTICSTCQGAMSQANHRLKSDPRYRQRINERFLSEEGLEYRGTTEVKHMLWAIIEDFGLERLRELVVHPLTGLRASAFYGCFLRRPSEIMAPEPYQGRKSYLEEVIRALGAEAVDTKGKSKCCGFPLLMHNERNSLAMAGDHTLEAKGKGVDCMVTPCPLCHLNLDGNQPRAAKQQGRPIDLPILHLPQLLGLAMGIPASDLGMKRHIIATGSVVRKIRTP